MGLVTENKNIAQASGIVSCEKRVIVSTILLKVGNVSLTF